MIRKSTTFMYDTGVSRRGRKIYVPQHEPPISKVLITGPALSATLNLVRVP